MPLDKRVCGTYICKSCALRISPRPFSSFRANFASLVGTESCPPDSQKFEVLPPLAPTLQSDGTSTDEAPKRGRVRLGEKGKKSRAPSQSLKITKIKGQPMVLDQQINSIEYFRKVTQELAKELRPEDRIFQTVRRVAAGKEDHSEQRYVKLFARAYAGKSISDIERDLSVIGDLKHRSRPGEKAAEVLARLSKASLLKIPTGTIWTLRTPSHGIDSEESKSTHRKTRLRQAKTVKATLESGALSSSKQLVTEQISAARKPKASGTNRALRRQAPPSSKDGKEQGLKPTVDDELGTPGRTRQPAEGPVSRKTKRGFRIRKTGSHFIHRVLSKPAIPLKFRKIPERKRALETRDAPEARSNAETEDGVESPRDIIHGSTIKATSLSISALPRTGPAVPKLCHDLSRVLFNPGVYHLQDPRSRVYNFDPYLEKIMPVSEFDFKVLKEYITSSEDRTMHALAVKHGKKYVGSSSSMTATLAQFHFLLSQWRKINTSVLSKRFTENQEQFTMIQRAPSSVFLRYQDGVYALDADKEFDSGNILMSLGKSMEKLLTQPPGDFERYRKSNTATIPEEERNRPEAYQFTVAGDFLMRAQLDAWDPRLPGTGTFDLKTRAVASIRHQTKEHEAGQGYEIRRLHGNWQSYEREYFDLVRSAFLKYSLQVRMGQMDGIFAAYHNIERIFGFQYISLPEMDEAIHGQSDSAVGDQEFKLSVEMLNQVLNYVTSKHPKQSLRLLFDTRNLPVSGVYTRVFAVPIKEEQIEAIQRSKKDALTAFEQKLYGPEDVSDAQGKDDATRNLDFGKALEDVLTPESSDTEPSEPSSTKRKPNVPGLLALRLQIQNRVNGHKTLRPDQLISTDDWSVDYSLEETPSERAQSLYRISQNRRKAALSFEKPSEDNFYIGELRKMAARGVEWRKARDALDAEREKQVLYPA